MSGNDKVKTGTSAGMMAWFLAIGSMVAGAGWIWSSWGAAASYAWTNSNVFKLRLIMWVLTFIPCAVLGGIGLSRILKGRLGKGIDDVRKENMLLKEQG